MSIPASLVTTVLPAVSALGALGMFVASVYGLHRGEANAARDEALALAATRAQMIHELEARVQALERAFCAQRVALLELAEVLVDVRSDLETEPPDVVTARARIDELASRRL